MLLSWSRYRWCLSHLCSSYPLRRVSEKILGKGFSGSIEPLEEGCQGRRAPGAAYDGASTLTEALLIRFLLLLTVRGGVGL